MFQRLTLTEPSRRIVLKERSPWLTPTESCESDETEVEDEKPFKAPLGLPGPLIEETRIRDPMHGCHTDVTTEVGSHLHPRYRQMKDMRPFEEIVSVKSSDERSDQTSFSVLSWNPGPKRGKVANSVVESFHVILVQEAQSHFHGVATSAEQQFHVYQGADRFVSQKYHSAWWCEDPGRDPRHVKARLIRHEILENPVKVQEAAQALELHVHSCLPRT